MADDSIKSMTDDTLRERFRALILGYDEACIAYDHARAAEIHSELYAVEDELRSRLGNDWRRTGLEKASLKKVLERFKECAIAYEDADGSDETEHLYWHLKAVTDELQRRPGDQRRALFALYAYPNIKVRHAAANATRTLAPKLSRHRLNHIDDDGWAPPVDGLDMVEAGIATVFQKRAHNPDKLSGLSLERLLQRFVDLSLQQADANLSEEISRFNRLYDQITGVKDELKRRPGDQRSALVTLFEHPSAQVRLVAATAALVVAPEMAREALQKLADSNEYPQSGEAGGRLRRLDSGALKPT